MSPRRRAHRSGSVSSILHCALAFALVASEASAAPAEQPTDPHAAALAEASKLYDDGVARYETFDYERAIDLWTQAYSRLPIAEETARVRADLVYNIARALQKLYEQDAAVKHLQRARQLYERYVEEKLASGVPETDAEIVDARERIAELKAQIEDAERRAAPPPVRAEPTPSDTPADTGPTSTGPPPGRGLVIAGSVLTAFGAAGVGATLAAGLLVGRRAQSDVGDLDALADEPMREDAIARGRTGNLVAIAGGAASGAVMITGVGLLVAGVVKRRRAGRVALVPTRTGGAYGLALRGRF